LYVYKTTVKNKNMQTIFYSSLSIFMSFAVFLCGMHAKDLSVVAIAPLPMVSKKASADDQSGHSTLVKTAPDLHNHIDKQTLKSLTHATDIMQADHRSLQRKRAHAHTNAPHSKSGWFGMLWHEYALAI
jgi:hypothetical protein